MSRERPCEYAATPATTIGQRQVTACETCDEQGGDKCLVHDDFLVRIETTVPGIT